MSEVKKIIEGHEHIKYDHDELSEVESLKKADQYFNFLNKRRTVRDIGSKPVDRKIIESIIKTASTAPSGAHKQPWTFCAVSNVEIKNAIRKAAEKEEYESYTGRMSERWLDDLKPMATNWEKPFLTEAPWLIIVFKKVYELDKEGSKSNNYYVNESVGIACGMLITAIHNAGLVTVTHTPSPMNFLSKILNRPENERPYLLLPVGYPKKEVYVPNFKRKQLDKFAIFYE